MALNLGRRCLPKFLPSTAYAHICSPLPTHTPPRPICLCVCVGLHVVVRRQFRASWFNGSGVHQSQAHHRHDRAVKVKAQCATVTPSYCSLAALMHGEMQNAGLRRRGPYGLVDTSQTMAYLSSCGYPPVLPSLASPVSKYQNRTSCPSSHTFSPPPALCCFLSFYLSFFSFFAISHGQGKHI